MYLETFPTHFNFLTVKNSLGTPLSVSSIHLLCLPLCYHAHNKERGSSLSSLPPFLKSPSCLSELTSALRDNGNTASRLYLLRALTHSTIPNLSKILLTHTHNHTKYTKPIYTCTEIFIYAHINK